MVYDTRSPASDKDLAPEGIGKKMDRGCARIAGPAEPEKWTGEGVDTADGAD